MKKKMRLALAQLNTTVGNLEGNAKKITEGIHRARKQKADLVLFPEAAITGYPPEDLLHNRTFVSENLKTLQRLARQAFGVTAVTGFIDRDREGRLYNAAAVLSNGKISYVYRKIELPNYGVFDEKRYFHSGALPGVFDLNGVSVGVTVCEDVWVEGGLLSSRGALKDAGLVLNLSASPFHRRKFEVRQTVMKNFAVRKNAYLAHLNLVGGQDELVFDGGSLLVSPEGRVLAQAARFEEDFIVADIPITGTASGRGKTVGERPPSDEEEVYAALCLGTRDYILKNGFKKTLVGLSGGIDSALVARVAVDALGKENVIGVTMPSPYSSKATYQDAIRLAKKLGIRCEELRIDGLYRQYLDLLARPFKGAKPNIAEENLQARIRGNLLMGLSNKFGHIVLTTGNKSEMATGYCTLYGDMAGGFAVLKDVPKTLVFKLCRYRNRFAPKNSIPESILRRPPTAELKPNQKDQDTLPPYSELDRILEDYVEKDKSAEDIVAGGANRKTVNEIIRKVDLSEYKRRQAPPGIKITPKAFGRDRRMPITNRYAGR